MKVRAIEPNVETGALLAGAQFVDAFSIAVATTRSTPGTPLSACSDARRDGSRR
jgi:hypothetical protein